MNLTKASPILWKPVVLRQVTQYFVRDKARQLLLTIDVQQQMLSSLLHEPLCVKFYTQCVELVYLLYSRVTHAQFAHKLSAIWQIYTHDTYMYCSRRIYNNYGLIQNGNK